jgi:hypothetical protein
VDLSCRVTQADMVVVDLKSPHRRLHRLYTLGTIHQQTVSPPIPDCQPGGTETDIITLRIQPDSARQETSWQGQHVKGEPGKQ